MAIPRCEDGKMRAGVWFSTHSGMCNEFALTTSLLHANICRLYYDVVTLPASARLLTCEKSFVATYRVPAQGHARVHSLRSFEKKEKNCYICLTQTHEMMSTNKSHGIEIGCCESARDARQIGHGRTCVQSLTWKFGVCPRKDELIIRIYKLVGEGIYIL